MKKYFAFNCNKDESSLTSFPSRIWHFAIDFTKGGNLALMIFLGGMLIIFVACQRPNKYDGDKQYAFLVKFTAGMSKQEVDAILANHQDITLLKEFQENGELVVRYSTPIEIYGSNIFTFRYSGELKLIYVIPVEPTD